MSADQNIAWAINNFSSFTKTLFHISKQLFYIVTPPKELEKNPAKQAMVNKMTCLFVCFNVNHRNSDYLKMVEKWRQHLQIHISFIVFVLILGIFFFIKVIYKISHLLYFSLCFLYDLFVSCLLLVINLIIVARPIPSGRAKTWTSLGFRFFRKTKNSSSTVGGRADLQNEAFRRDI